MPGHNKNGPWRLAGCEGQPTALARLCCSFPVSGGMTAEEISLRYCDATRNGLSIAASAGLLKPSLVRGVPGWVATKKMAAVRHEMWLFEAELPGLLLSEKLPCSHPGGALMLERSADGALAVHRNYGPCSTARAE